MNNLEKPISYGVQWWKFLNYMRIICVVEFWVKMDPVPYTVQLFFEAFVIIALEIWTMFYFPNSHLGHFHGGKKCRSRGCTFFSRVRLNINIEEFYITPHEYLKRSYSAYPQNGENNRVQFSQRKLFSRQNNFRIRDKMKRKTNSKGRASTEYDVGEKP